jgi:murein DD-endopeptidase MepM/ murein hydrolase activator NlpD
MAEGSLRELTGPSRVLGNHVVLDLGDGVYAVLAHLRHGSLRVAKGQRVRAGQQVAECGNSGNSTEPHLHFQLMDHRSVLFAAGRHRPGRGAGQRPAVHGEGVSRRVGGPPLGGRPGYRLQWVSPRR